MNVVARIGKPHGIRGEVTVEVRTDAPDQRFVAGAGFATLPDRGTLTLKSARWHNSRLLLTFDELSDRNRAEEFRNTELLVAADDIVDEDDAWDSDELEGLTVEIEDADGRRKVGEVLRVDYGVAQDLLVFRHVAGHEVLVPFVEQIVPEVDVDAGRILLDPPGGLLDPPDA
ncbi:ribosome maturation factor RimM [Saxibacter everestensis]|uniref:Ribosome maturation factor RimM n=1 Tax=Saxibacter everestensis TaxID=2909229 RepID=A0ABY8QXH6_9MICO|nr:ribosome maturation factor RimM [Brevibacteriaceae bacterium ZFBP1038]